MITSKTKKIDFRQSLVPMVLVLVGLLIIIPSIPGQGNNISIAIGLGFVVLAGIAARTQKKSEDTD